MSKVTGKNTRPELVVRQILHRLGFRFRLHVKYLPGKPDIVLPKHRAVIFVHGCFWHSHVGCKRAKRPSSNVSFWNPKLDGNMKRDSQNVERLITLRWRVLKIWECEIVNTIKIEFQLRDFLLGNVNDESK